MKLAAKLHTTRAASREKGRSLCNVLRRFSFHFLFLVKESIHMVENMKKQVFSVRGLVEIGMLSALAFVLMLFSFPLPFAPSFYKLDFSELPVVIGAFAIHPFAGVMIELIKMLLNLLIDGSATAGVGEIANFFIGCCFILPASVIYHRKKSKRNAIFGLCTGTILMTIVGCFLNAYVLLPAYSVAFHMEIEKLIAMGAAVNPSIDNLFTFVLLAVAPFNLLKGALVSIITILIYKRISIILKGKA